MLGQTGGEGERGETLQMEKLVVNVIFGKV